MGKAYTIYSDGKRKIVSVPQYVKFSVGDKIHFVQLNDEIALMLKSQEDISADERRVGVAVDMFLTVLSSYYGVDKVGIAKTIKELMEAYLRAFGE